MDYLADFIGVMTDTKVSSLILDVALDLSRTRRVHIVYGGRLGIFFNDAGFDLVKLCRTAFDALNFTFVRKSYVLLLFRELGVFDTLLVVVADNIVG